MKRALKSKSFKKENSSCDGCARAMGHAAVLWHSTKAQRAVLEKTHTDSRQHTDSLPQLKL